LGSRGKSAGGKEGEARTLLRKKIFIIKKWGGIPGGINLYSKSTLRGGEGGGHEKGPTLVGGRFLKEVQRNLPKNQKRSASPKGKGSSVRGVIRIKMIRKWGKIGHVVMAV